MTDREKRGSDPAPDPFGDARRRASGPSTPPPSPPGTPNGTVGGLDPRVAGVLAGLVSAVMIGSTVLGFALSGVLFFFAALPIFFVGHSHGSVAAIIAGAVSILGVASFNSLTGAMFAAASVSVPAAYAAYLLNLARPAEELGGPSDRMAWFPLADVLLRICLVVAAGTVAVGVAVGYDAAALGAAIDAALSDIAQTNPDQFGQMLDAEARQTTVGTVVALMPVFQPAIAVITLVANLYLASRIARARGRSKRPPDDMPLALRLPVMGLIVFAVVLVLSFLSGPLALAARAFAGALGMGFTVAGFAALHHRSRGLGARIPLLIAVYLGTLIFTVPAIAMLALGVFSTARAVPVSKKGP